VHERYRRQTDDRRQTDGRQHIANVNVNSRSLKTVRPMLSVRLSVCLSYMCRVLSVTLVYCNQTVGWIKMKHDVQLGLGPGHIVLDGDPPPPPKRGTVPQF